MNPFSETRRLVRAVSGVRQHLYLRSRKEERSQAPGRTFPQTLRYSGGNKAASGRATCNLSGTADRYSASVSR